MKRFESFTYACASVLACIIGTYITTSKYITLQQAILDGVVSSSETELFRRFGVSVSRFVQTWAFQLQGPCKVWCSGSRICSKRSDFGEGLRRKGVRVSFGLSIFGQVCNEAGFLIQAVCLNQTLSAFEGMGVFLLAGLRGSDLGCNL